MKRDIFVAQVRAREVLDSRANPTVEVEVILSDGARGRASVPSGASTGANEAVELRDGDPDRFCGLGVLKAVENIRQRISPHLVGYSPIEQAAVDQLLIDLDGTSDKSSLGANTVLGVSVAVARATARSLGLPLYAHLSPGSTITLPTPMLNIINGGRHAENSTDFQEFMVVPAGFDTFHHALRAGVEVYHSLREVLLRNGKSTNVGDEGGFAPSLDSNLEAVELVLSAIEKAGYEPGVHCFIGLDVAASELLDDAGSYYLACENLTLLPEELISRYEHLIEQFPIVSIEDGMAEEDWDSWHTMTERLGDRIQLVGDDLFTTNVGRIRKGIERKAGNAVLIKANQIGTVTETLEAVRMAEAQGWGIVVSHRSGETEDTMIADLAVGTGATQIKAGAPARGERTAKYNRLLRIEEQLGDTVGFAGLSGYARFTKSL